MIKATGALTIGEQAVAHVAEGAHRVLVTAPCEGGDVTIVAGVNENDYQSAKHQIISAGSCTTSWSEKQLSQRYTVLSP